MKEMAEMPLYRQTDYNHAIGTLHSEAAVSYTHLHLGSAGKDQDDGTRMA